MIITFTVQGNVRKTGEISPKHAMRVTGGNVPQMRIAPFKKLGERRFVISVEAIA